MSGDNRVPRKAKFWGWVALVWTLLGVFFAIAFLQHDHFHDPIGALIFPVIITVAGWAVIGNQVKDL